LHRAHVAAHGIVTSVVAALASAPAAALHGVKEYLRMDPQAATAYAAMLIATVQSSKRAP
jgi:hypothetical protein